MTSTVNVTVTLKDSNDAAIVGATVMAELVGLDVYNNTYYASGMTSGRATAITDASGQAVLALFPNSLGTRNSHYRFTAVHPTTGKKLLDTTGYVPNADCSLAQIDSMPASSEQYQVGSQPYSPVLTSWASFVGAANKVVISTGPASFGLADLTAFGRSVIAVATAAAAIALFAATTPTFAGMTLNANAAALPAPPTGTVMQIGGANNTNTNAALYSFGNNGGGAGVSLTLYRSQGTAAAPTVPTNTTGIGNVFAGSYDGAAWQLGAWIQFRATETWSGTARGTAVAIGTTANGTTALRDVATFGQDGMLDMTVASVRVPNNVAFRAYDSGAVSRDILKLDSSNNLLIGPAAGGITSVQLQFAGTTYLKLGTGGRITINGATDDGSSALQAAGAFRSALGATGVGQVFSGTGSNLQLYYPNVAGNTYIYNSGGGIVLRNALNTADVLNSQDSGVTVRGTHTVTDGTTFTANITSGGASAVNIGGTAGTLVTNIKASGAVIGSFSTTGFSVNGGMSASTSGEAGITVTSTGAATGAEFVAQSGNGTTSARYAYLRSISLETSSQSWAAGMFGSQSWQVRDETGSRTPLAIVPNAGRVLINNATDDGSSSLQVNGIGSVSGNLLLGSNVIMTNAGATMYLGTAAGTGAIANDSGSSYFVLYGHSHASAGNVDLVTANLRATGGYVSASAGFKAASTLAFFHTQEMNTLAGNTSIALTGTPNGALIVVRNITDGGVAVFLAEATITPTLLSQTQTNFNAGDSGASTSKICVYNNAGTISIFNRYAAAKRISLNIIAPH